MKPEPPTPIPDDADRRRAEQLARITAWTDRGRQPDPEAAPGEVAEDVPAPVANAV
jgi:hypothetical protein